MTLEKTHRTIFLFASALLAVAMSSSPFFISVAELLLVLNWIVEGGLRTKVRAIADKRAVLLIVSLYLLHVVWLVLTSNFSYALHDLRIKLPLLVLPIIYSTTAPFSLKEFKIVVQLFIVAVIVNTIIIMIYIFGLFGIVPLDYRFSSLFISHIRFSLFVVLSLYVLVYLVLFNYLKLSAISKLCYIISIIWLVVFLIMFRAFSGIVIFALLLPFSIIWFAVQKRGKALIGYSIGVGLVIILFMVFYGVHSYKRFNKKYTVRTELLDSLTANGHTYTHNINSAMVENGHQVWIYLAEAELEKEWNSVSEIDYASTDLKGQQIRFTLIRYLSSLGYRKDSVGISKLTDKDIAMIEHGSTNYLQKSKFSLYPRMYELFWEIERYSNGENPGGQSVSQRIEYLKTGMNIVKRFFWTGTGTGDIQDEFNHQYRLDNSELIPIYQKRTHNQFVTFFITFGLFGFLWFLYAIFYPPYIEKKYCDYIFVIFFLIALLSMLSEDTLETHVGVSFFAFFNSILLFSAPQFSSYDKTRQ